MNYTQAQIDRANAVSLEDFLRTQGETLIKSGREYRWKEHDSLTVRGNKWFRHSQSKGGYPIDFVMEFYGKSFPEAVQLLTGESGEGQTEASTAPPTAFHLPLHNRIADRAIQYLCESRGLNKTLVEAFLLSGDIYEDAKRHNVVFVGRDRSGTPRYAHVRGTADSFRQDIAGSDKSYPFHYEGNSNQLFIFEAPIDLLSFICRTGRQGAILPWAAFLAKPLTVFFLNARTPEKCSSALTATPLEMKPAHDWHSPFPVRLPSFALSRQGKIGTMFSASKGTFPAANS